MARKKKLYVGRKKEMEGCSLLEMKIYGRGKKKKRFDGCKLKMETRHGRAEGRGMKEDMGSRYIASLILVDMWVKVKKNRFNFKFESNI